jgi:D-inositol-3-phosphate glycosyltransferase
VALMLARRTSAVRVITEHVGRVGYSIRLLDRVERVAIAGLGRLTAHSAEGIVVLNEKVRIEMSTLAPLAKIVSIPNGVDTSLYRPAEPGERDLLRRQLGWDAVPRVLFVGRLVTKKGIHSAVSAVERLNGRVRLVVVGPGELQPGPFVDVIGPLPRPRVAELYRAADMFMLPSRGEGFPLTAQEAMASGLPTILSDDPSYAPYLTDEGTRAVPHEPEALAQAVLSFLLPEARMRAGRAAFAKARADFSWKAAALAHLRLYHCLAEGRRATTKVGRR